MAAEQRRPRWLFWLSAAVGWAIIAYGLRGLFHHHVDTRPANLARFVVGGALVHDLVFAPLVLVAGVLVARAFRGSTRSWVQAGLLISGCLVLFSYPLVRDYAKVLHNPSSLPHDYSANLAITVGVVWAIVVVGALAVAALRRRRAAPQRA